MYILASRAIRKGVLLLGLCAERVAMSQTMPHGRRFIADLRIGTGKLINLLRELFLD